MMGYFKNELANSPKSKGLGDIDVSEIFEFAIGLPVDGRNRLMRGYLH